MTELKTPKVRKDGLCFICRGERPFNPQKGVPLGEYLKDPFCSSLCSRTYWGTPIVPVPMGAPRKGYST